MKYDSERKVIGIEVLFLSQQEAVVELMPEEMKDEFRKGIDELVKAVKTVA